MERNMKKILAILFVIILASCSASNANSSEPVNNGISSEEDPFIAKEEETDTPWTIQYSFDRDVVYEEDIGLKLIGRIKSIDGCDNYWEDQGIYAGTYTYGKLEVIKALKGDIKEGDVIDFAIGGGTIPFEKYAKGQDPQSLEKQIRLYKEHGSEIPETVKTILSPVELKEGKAYYLGTSEERNFHGKIYLIYPCEEVLMEIDESTLNQEEILGYNVAIKEWINVLDMWYPENRYDTRTSRDGK